MKEHTDASNIFAFPQPFQDPLTRRVSIVVSTALERVLRLHRLGKVYAEIGETDGC